MKTTKRIGEKLPLNNRHDKAALQRNFERTRKVNGNERKVCFTSTWFQEIQTKQKTEIYRDWKSPNGVGESELWERDWENMLRVVLAKVFYLFASLLSLERILKCLFIFGKLFQLNSHENDDNFYSRILLFSMLFVLSLLYFVFFCTFFFVWIGRYSEYG